MASRRLFQFRYSYQRDIVDIFAKISIGAVGAPTLVTVGNGGMLNSMSKGVASVSRISAGKYQINLQDPFAQLIMAKSVMINSSATTAAPSMLVVQDNSPTNPGPNVIVQFLDPTGAAIDPASGENILIQLVLKNTQA
jgi:hypothetical protein